MSNHSYQLRNVSKYYGKFKALDDVNLTLEQGKIIGLLGKNGAGKSTLMRCMLGFLKHSGEISYHSPTGSSVDVDLGSAEKPSLLTSLKAGLLSDRNRVKMFENVAFIPDVNGLDDRLSVQQTIEYIRDLNPKWNEERASKLLEISQLPMKKKVGKLSKGMKTKLYLLITLSLEVNFLLLDEPTLGLDIAFRKEFFNTILGEYFDENKTIIISTHQVEEVEDLLQEIVFIDNGKIILHEDVESLKAKYRVLTLPLEQAEKLNVYSPKVLSKTLGFISAVLPTEVEIEGAEYSRANLADIFLAVVGGN